MHNIEDIDIIRDIIKEKYPDYVEHSDRFFESKEMFICNMFIMKCKDFLKYVDFVRDIMSEYINRVGTDIKKRIEDNKDKYLKDFGPNDTIDYQHRLGGFLIERLTNIFLLANFKEAIGYDVKVTENKYEGVEEKTI